MADDNQGETRHGLSGLGLVTAHRACQLLSPLPIKRLHVTLHSVITVESNVLAANLTAYLEGVIGAGKTFVITMNGHPVAELCPPVAAMVALYHETKYMPDDQELERCRELVELVGMARVDIGRKYGVEADSTVLIREDRDFLH